MNLHHRHVQTSSNCGGELVPLCRPGKAKRGSAQIVEGVLGRSLQGPEDFPKSLVLQGAQQTSNSDQVCAVVGGIFTVAGLLDSVRGLEKERMESGVRRCGR